MAGWDQAALTFKCISFFTTATCGVDILVLISARGRSLASIDVLYACIESFINSQDHSIICFSGTQRNKTLLGWWWWWLLQPASPFLWKWNVCRSAAGLFFDVTELAETLWKKYNYPAVYKSICARWQHWRWNHCCRAMNCNTAITKTSSWWKNVKFLNV